MREFKIFVEFKNGLNDIYNVKAESLELAKYKVLKQNEAKLNSSLFRDKASKIISTREFK